MKVRRVVKVTIDLDERDLSELTFFLSDGLAMQIGQPRGRKTASELLSAINDVMTEDV